MDNIQLIGCVCEHTALKISPIHCKPTVSKMISHSSKSLAVENVWFAKLKVKIIVSLGLILLIFLVIHHCKKHRNLLGVLPQNTEYFWMLWIEKYLKGRVQNLQDNKIWWISLAVVFWEIHLESRRCCNIMLWMVLFLAKSRTLEKPQLQLKQDMLCESSRANKQVYCDYSWIWAMLTSLMQLRV